MSYVSSIVVAVSCAALGIGRVSQEVQLVTALTNHY